MIFLLAYLDYSKIQEITIFQCELQLYALTLVNLTAGGLLPSCTSIYDKVSQLLKQGI